MRFYLQTNPERVVKVQKNQLWFTTCCVKIVLHMIFMTVLQMLPQTFREQHIRVYCRKQDKASLAAAWRYLYFLCMVLHSCATE